MKKITIAMAAMAAALVATPAMAESNFDGPRVEVIAGVDDVTSGIDKNDVTYGAAVGYDVEVIENVTFGVEARVDNVFDRRDIGASVRVGYELNDNVLVYAKGGYANYADVVSGDLDGLRVGGGIDVNLTGPFYTGVEYQYTDFDANVGKHAVSAKVGVRF